MRHHPDTRAYVRLTLYGKTSTNLRAHLCLAYSVSEMVGWLTSCVAYRLVGWANMDLSMFSPFSSARLAFSLFVFFFLT